MSTTSSEDMMNLLKELSLLKKADEEDGKSAAESVEFQERQERRSEIAANIKTLAKQSKLPDEKNVGAGQPL